MRSEKILSEPGALRLLNERRTIFGSAIVKRDSQ